MNMQLSNVRGEALHVEQVVNEAWKNRDKLFPGLKGPVLDTVTQILNLLDDGSLRIAEKIDGRWHTNDWLINALMISEQIGEYALINGGPDGSGWWDKDRPKFAGWGEDEFRAAGIRALPHAIVRYSAHIAPKVILMPCFVSWGARVGEGTTIDSWVTVGSCAQVGRNVHVSAGVCLGGIIEPKQVRPVIIEDDCFIGAQCSVVEGMIVGQGSVIGAGTVLSASTKIVDRKTGEVFQGEVPPYSVVVPGVLPGAPLADGTPGPLLSCAVIVKRVDEKTRAKTCMNDLFRNECQGVHLPM